MAEFLGQPKPKKTDLGHGSGFDAFGKFVSPERRSHAYSNRNLPVDGVLVCWVRLACSVRQPPNSRQRGER